jgi:hypothetical protein
VALRACLRYIHSLRRLDHASHLETCVMGASLDDYSRIQLLSFLYMSGNHAICLRYFALLRPRVRGIWQSRLIVLLR